MKAILLFLSTLILSPTALAFESHENSKIDAPGQMSTQMEAPLNQESLPDTLSTKDTDNARTKTKAPVEKRDEFFIRICVYLIIILVYWFYWLKNGDIAKEP